MTTMRISRGIWALAIASAIPLALLGCPKKKDDKPVSSAEPPPPPPPAVSSVSLTPLDEDAGPDGGEDAAPDVKKPTGQGNYVLACCARLQQKAAGGGFSPEAAQAAALAAQCYAQARGLGNSPEGKQMQALARQYCF